MVIVCLLVVQIVVEIVFFVVDLMLVDVDSCFIIEVDLIEVFVVGCVCDMVVGCVLIGLYCSDFGVVFMVKNVFVFDCLIGE